MQEFDDNFVLNFRPIIKNVYRRNCASTAEGRIFIINFAELWKKTDYTTPRMADQM